MLTVVLYAQVTRLDNRWLDLRVPASGAIMRIQSAVGNLFRDGFLRHGFVEIHTPKLLPGESEGGSEVFKTDYFGKVVIIIVMDGSLSARLTMAI